jgi:hypothetical protein
VTRGSGRTAHVAALLIGLASVGAWIATGREGFTRWPDARLEASDAPVSDAEQDLLDEIGVGSEPASESARIESRFAFGLLPGGADPKHLPSVATGLVFATGVSAVAMLRRRLTRNPSRETTP